VKYFVRLTSRAEQDVAEVLGWFHDQRATAAGGRWYRRLMDHIDTLEHNPQRCALADEAEEIDIEIRELLIGNRRRQYRLLFHIRKRTVNILRVWHSARDAVSRDDL